MPPTAPIQESVMIDRRVPVALHALVGAIVRRPEDIIASRLDLEQRAAGTITLGNKDSVVHDDRIAGVLALVGAGAPREMEIDLAAGRLEADQAPARQNETPAPAVNRSQDRAGIARQLVADL